MILCLIYQPNGIYRSKWNKAKISSTLKVTWLSNTVNSPHQKPMSHERWINMLLMYVLTRRTQENRCDRQRVWGARTSVRVSERIPEQTQKEDTFLCAHSLFLKPFSGQVSVELGTVLHTGGESLPDNTECQEVTCFGLKANVSCGTKSFRWTTCFSALHQ